MGQPEEIIELLKEYGQLTVKQIAERMQKDLGNMSKAIKRMVNAGIVKKIQFSPEGSTAHSHMVQLTEDYEAKLTTPIKVVRKSSQTKREILETLEDSEQPPSEQFETEDPIGLDLSDMKESLPIVNKETCENSEIPEYILKALRTILKSEKGRSQNGKWETKMALVDVVAGFFKIEV